MKIDPRRADNPWSGRSTTTAIGGQRRGHLVDARRHGDIVVTTTNAAGRRPRSRHGRSAWEFELPGPVWQSPVIVDDASSRVTASACCAAYDVSDTPSSPPLKWQLEIGGCIEATPTVWDGRIYFGTRAGGFYAVGDA